MAVITIQRLDKVTHRSAVAAATHGTVVATFNDLQGRPCAAVQWAGGYFGVSRLKWLVKL